jgi:hypothetical protein
MALESGLQNVLFLNLYLAILYMEINFEKLFFSSQFVHQLIDPWNWVLVLYGILVKGLVNAHSQGVVLLFDQYYRRSKQTRARLNVTHLEKILDSFLNIVFVIFWMSVGVAYDYLDPFF